MERSSSNILQAIKDAKGISYYGELLLVNSQETAIHSLRADAHKKIESLQPAGDVFNVIQNIDVLRGVSGNKIQGIFEQTFVGPISADDLGGVLLNKLPFPVGKEFCVSEGEVGLCRVSANESGDMLITLDTERAAIRDALRNTLYRESVIREAQRSGLFYTSLIALGMTRNCNDFIEMINAIHASKAVSIFDTNYRSYVMEHCYPQRNTKTIASVLAEILPRIDIFLAGTEDLFHIYPEAQRDIGFVQDALCKNVRPATLSILKAGKDGVYWRDEGGHWKQRPANAAEVINTTGAGDAFNAGFLFALKQGVCVEEAITFANSLAAKIVGSTETLLTEAEAVKIVSNLSP